MRKDETKCRFFFSHHFCLKLLKIAIWIILNDALVSFTLVLTPLLAAINGQNAFSFSVKIDVLRAHITMSVVRALALSIRVHKIQDIKVYAITLKILTVYNYYALDDDANHEQMHISPAILPPDILLLICHRCVYKQIEICMCMFVQWICSMLENGFICQ